MTKQTPPSLLKTYRIVRTTVLETFVEAPPALTEDDLFAILRRAQDQEFLVCEESDRVVEDEFLKVGLATKRGR